MKKIGLIGCGYWGKNYVKTIEKIDKVQLTWIYNAHTEITDERLPKNSRFTKNYSDILRDKDTSAVIIATPAQTHYKIAKEVLLAGKDVLIEKPMTIKSREAKDLVELAARKSQILMVGHIYLYNPAIFELKRRIKKGELGKINYIYSRRSGWGPFYKGISVLWSLAPHDISIANYLLDKTPKKIRAEGVSFLSPGFEDSVDLVLNYTDNLKAFFHLSWSEPKKVRETIIVGDKKTAIFDEMAENKLIIYSNADINNFSIIKTENISPLEKQCRHFIDCLNKRKKPLTDGHEGYQNVLVLEAAQKSLRLNKPIINSKN